MRFFVALFAAACSALFAQSPLTLPGCEPRPDVQRVLDEKLSESELRKMPRSQGLAYQRRVLEDLIAKYPREVEPQRRLLESTKEEDTGQYPALVEIFQKQAEKHPDDPLALYLAGAALYNRDTPLSIRCLEQARSLAPDFAWPELDLAQVYSPGTKRADKTRAAAYIEAFFKACPSSTDQRAQTLLAKAGGSELQQHVAAALRTRLQGETDPHRLLDYTALWGLEFRTRPTQEQDILRKQVAADLKRLESLNPEPDAAWLVFMKDGYKQSGAKPETVTAMEDRVIAAFPHSEEAYRIVSDRWNKQHKEPPDQRDAIAWAKYRTEYKAALEGWIRQFTESRQLQHEEWFDFYLYDVDVPVTEGLKALDDYLAEFNGDPPRIGTRLEAAEFLVMHKWQPQRALELLQDSDALIDQWHARVMGDNLSAEGDDIWRNNEIIERQEAAGCALQAARMLQQSAEGERRKAFIERDLPTGSWPIIETHYWQNRGRLAWLEQRKTDALAYYQKALFVRKRPPQPFRGHIFDDLTAEAHSLWQSMGGSEKAWLLWSKPPANIQAIAESGWKKPTKDMPAFELADLAGKTWRLQDLRGRAVLINVWATWCGPCQAELPKLEKLYEQVKDRSDLQILTLTIDEDLGAVGPFLKDKGYTFPVLPAFSFVTGLLDLVAIPQNWIVDSKGVWRWTGAPNGPDEEWGKAMLQQLESAR